MHGRWLPSVIVLAGWTVLVIVFAVSSSLTYALTYQPPRWRYTLTMAATEWYVWAAMTPAIVWLSRRFQIAGWQWRHAMVIAAAGAPVAFAKVTLTRILRVAIGGSEQYFQITNLVTQYLIFWIILLVAYASDYYRDAQQRALRTTQLEALLAQTRLQMLSMQLQPHFLFNTLNTIAELVHQRPDTAERMIADLSHLLRETLQAGAVDRVHLVKELDLVRRYIDIQQTRFGERLQVDVSAADDAVMALVPSLLLQPLVENAITHGIGTRAGAGRIDVIVKRCAAQLLIEVRDDGVGLHGGVADGIGMTNCRSRLEALYGASGFELDLAARAGGGAVVRIAIPFQTA